MKTLRLISDSGHGWLEVDKITLCGMKLADCISPYSYDGAINAYLEEDCDASLFMTACAALGDIPEIKEVYHDGESPIRGYRRYDAKPDWKERAFEMRKTLLANA